MRTAIGTSVVLGVVLALGGMPAIGWPRGYGLAWLPFVIGLLSLHALAVLVVARAVLGRWTFIGESRA